jgi:hypothetical protein
MKYFNSKINNNLFNLNNPNSPFYNKISKINYNQYFDPNNPISIFSPFNPESLYNPYNKNTPFNTLNKVILYN